MSPRHSRVVASTNRPTRPQNCGYARAETDLHGRSPGSCRLFGPSSARVMRTTRPRFRRSRTPPECGASGGSGRPGGSHHPGSHRSCVNTSSTRRAFVGSLGGIAPLATEGSGLAAVREPLRDPVWDQACDEREGCSMRAHDACPSHDRAARGAVGSTASGVIPFGRTLVRLPVCRVHGGGTTTAITVDVDRDSIGFLELLGAGDGGNPCLRPRGRWRRRGRGAAPSR